MNDNAQLDKPVLKPLPFKIEPTGDQVLIELITDTGSPIIVPPNSMLGPEARFVVHAVGEGRLTSSGQMVAIPLKAGDMVIINPVHQKLKLDPERDFDNRTFIVISYDGIACKVEGRPRSDRSEVPKIVRATPEQAEVLKKATRKVLHA